MRTLVPLFVCMGLAGCHRGPTVTFLASAEGGRCYASVGRLANAETSLERQQPMPWRSESSVEPGDRVSLRVVAEPGRGCTRVSCEIQADGRILARGSGLSEAHCEAHAPSAGAR